MEQFLVTLTKSYGVTISAESENDAARLAEFFTGDIQDLSSEKEKKEYRFEIHSIKCVLNEAFDCEEIEEEV
jgi:hypothetical protein